MVLPNMSEGKRRRSDRQEGQGWPRSTCRRRGQAASLGRRTAVCRCLEYHYIQCYFSPDKVNSSASLAACPRNHCEESGFRRVGWRTRVSVRRILCSLSTKDGRLVAQRHSDHNILGSGRKGRMGNDRGGRKIESERVGWKARTRQSGGKIRLCWARLGQR